MIAATALFALVNPPLTPIMVSDYFRTGKLDREWVNIESAPGHLPRSLVAAEDANFCEHWGFDVAAIRAASSSGSVRGGSSISQQTAKNLLLWRGRSWVRKAIETPLTLLVEIFWTKRRILEVYLNIIEFDHGVFGAVSASRLYFDKEVSELTELESARLAAILPNPKEWDASSLPERLGDRAYRIVDGARTIAADGRSNCFDP